MHPAAAASPNGAPAPARDNRRQPTPPRSLPLRHRVVTHAGRVWIVREADGSLASDAPRDHCLLCESALTVRRTWQYPHEWARLPDAELLRLFG